MPARFQITGSDITSRAELTDYLRRALERAARLGISSAVFGSPWSRSCPEHYSREAAFGQIAEFLSLAGEEAAPYQVVIAIEPINRGTGRGDRPEIFSARSATRRTGRGEVRRSG